MFLQSPIYEHTVNRFRIPLYRILHIALTQLNNVYIYIFLPGNPSQSSLIEVDCFFSPIFSYFCLLVAALRPCQGNEPRKKYINTWPKDSKSSLLDCSVIELITCINRKANIWLYLFLNGYWYSCIEQFPTNFYVLGKVYAALSLDHDIAWPYHSQ